MDLGLLSLQAVEQAEGFGPGGDLSTARLAEECIKGLAGSEGCGHPDRCWHRPSSRLPARQRGGADRNAELLAQGRCEVGLLAVLPGDGQASSAKDAPRSLVLPRSGEAALLARTQLSLGGWPFGIRRHDLQLNPLLVPPALLGLTSSLRLGMISALTSSAERRGS